MREKTCCFTGHRNIKAGEIPAIRRAIRMHVLFLLTRDVCRFEVGGATGFDMVAAEELLEIRDREQKDIEVISVLPFPQWREKWKKADAERQDRIMEKSDEVLFVREEHSRCAYLARDRRMVDDSSYCIAFCKRETGGTAYTVRYAESRGVQVFNTAELVNAQTRERKGGAPENGQGKR